MHQVGDQQGFMKIFTNSLERVNLVKVGSVKTSFT